MTSSLPRDVLDLGQLFVDTGHEIRVVGGWVRDTLRGVPPKDLDLATTATPDQMIALCRTNQIKVIETGLKHGTISAVLDQPYEITTLRIDVETDGRRARVEFTDDWKKDAERRDFTINAMSMSLDGKLYDYFEGKKHIEDRRVIFVGDAERRIREDYLRILRYFRFCGRIGDLIGYNDFYREIRNNAKGLQGISGERIWLEMAKILGGNHVEHQLTAMWAMEITDHIRLTELGPIDIYRAEAVRKATDNAITVLAALTAKPVGEAWRMSSNERTLLEWLQIHRDTPSPTLDELKAIATGARNGPERAVEYAAMFGSSPALDAIRAWDIPDFPVRGADLVALGMAPGPDIGLALDKLKQVWKDSGYRFRKDALIASLYAED